jgi:hypothetical protein
VFSVALPRLRPRRASGSIGALGTALVLVSLAPGAARAQNAISGFALDRFEPSAAGSQWLTLDSLDFEGHWRPAFGAVADWAYRPLVFYDPGGHEIAALVSQQAMVDLDAAVTMWNRARFDLALPVPVVASGGDVRIRDQTYSGPSAVGIGDLRLGGDVRLVHGPRDPWRIGAGAYLFIPTGATRHFSSDDGVRFWPRVTAAGDWRKLAWGARVGVQLRPGDSCHCNLAPGSELTLGAGAGWWIAPRVLVGAELGGSFAVSSSGPFSRAAPPLELLLTGHMNVTSRWRASAALGPGLTDGPGSPTMRVVLGATYELPAPSAPLPAAPPAWENAAAAVPTRGLAGSTTSPPVSLP